VTLPLIEEFSLILSEKPNRGIRRDIARKPIKTPIIKNGIRFFTVLL